MVWDPTFIFRQLLGADNSYEPKILPSQMHIAFSTVKREIISLKDIISQNSDNYTGATLSSQNCLLDNMPFTEEECLAFDARILTMFSHINGLIDSILKELKLYTSRELAENAYDTENALEVLEYQLRRDESKNAIQYFEGVANILYAQAAQIFEDFKVLPAKRREIVSSNCLHERSRQQVYRLNMGKNTSIGSNFEKENPSGAFLEKPVGSPQDLPGIWSVVRNMEDRDSSYTDAQHATNAPIGQLRANTLLLPSLIEEVNIVRHTEETAHEIQALNTIFTDKIMEQSEQIDRIYAVTFETSGTLDNANRYLKKAAKRLHDTTKLTVVLMCLAIFCLIFLDYIN